MALPLDAAPWSPCRATRPGPRYRRLVAPGGVAIDLAARRRAGGGTAPGPCSAPCARRGEAARCSPNGARDQTTPSGSIIVARELAAGLDADGSAEHRYHGNLNLRATASRLGCLELPRRFSAGSAAPAARAGEPRPRALAWRPRGAREPARLCRYTTEEALRNALGLVEQAAARQQSSPAFAGEGDRA